MSDLRSYLAHLTSVDYKISLSKQQQTIRTYEYSTNKQDKDTRQYYDSLESSGFSFSGSEKGERNKDEEDEVTIRHNDEEQEKESEGNGSGMGGKYMSYDPEIFIKKAQQLMKGRRNSIPLNNLTELMNQALQILNVIQNNNSKHTFHKSKNTLKKKTNNEQFADRLMVFLEWVQERIENERTRSTERKKSKENVVVDQRKVKRREFYDKTGKVTIQIRKIPNQKRVSGKKR